MARRGRPRSQNPIRRSSNSGDRSYRNILYGAVTVIIIFFVGIFLLNLFHKAGTVGDNGAKTANTDQAKTYTVQEGDTLWSISQKMYNDAYQWPKLMEANKILDPNVIEKGVKLVIPEKANLNIAEIITPTPTSISGSEPSVTPTLSSTATPTKVPAAPTSTMTNTQPPALGAQPGEKITGNSYTVVRGDNLWNIAVRAYGDGFRWVEIAKANNLANPRIIHAGNVFTIPR